MAQRRDTPPPPKKRPRKPPPEENLELLVTEVREQRCDT
jgi:hypothetical protein